LVINPIFCPQVECLLEDILVVRFGLGKATGLSARTEGRELSKRLSGGDDASCVKICDNLNRAVTCGYDVLGESNYWDANTDAGLERKRKFGEKIIS